MLIRKVKPSDAADIAAIYNHHVLNTNVTFDTEPLSVETMRDKIASIAACYPYVVCEKEGRVAGFCYAHQWKEKAAYAHTWETTVYVSEECLRYGIGDNLMRHLISECRNSGNCHALIACITSPNPSSEALHRELGFKQVSHFRGVGYKFHERIDVTDWELEL